MALPLVAAHVALLVNFDLAARPAATLGCFFVAFLGLLIADRSLRRTVRPSVPGILLVAALLRLLLLPLPPSLSNDILRYEWDGRVTAAGFNPYRLSPDSAELEILRDDLWESMDHKTIPTLYPPLALSLFAVASRMPAPQLVIKGALCVIDLVTCWLLVVLARRMGIPVSRTIWYSWNPLTTFEVAGMGHVDALAVAATITAVVCLMDRSPRLLGAGLAAAAGVLAKIVPLTTVPLWARVSGRPWRFVMIVGGVVLIVLGPVFLTTGGVPTGLVAYGVSWEFNGPLFEPLWRSLDFLETPRLLAAGLDQFRAGVVDFPNSSRLYAVIYPQFIAKVVLALLLLTVIAVLSRRSELVLGTAQIFGWTLLCSATVYPWYLLWVLPWAALLRHPPWMLLSGLVMLSYVPMLFAIDLWPWIYVAIWVPFVCMHYWYPRWSIN